MENGEKDLPNKIQIFDNSKIRSVWDSENEKWYFAIVDVVAVLSESENPQAYWRKLKQRLKKEGNETVTNCHALKLPAADGKMRQNCSFWSRSCKRCPQVFGKTRWYSHFFQKCKGNWNSAASI